MIKHISDKDLGPVAMKPFRIRVAEDVLEDMRARLRHTRWPDQIPGIGWKQGTELEWLQRLVSYWAERPVVGEQSRLHS